MRALTTVLIVAALFAAAATAQQALQMLWNASAVNHGMFVVGYGGAVFNGGVIANTEYSVQAVAQKTGLLLWSANLTFTDPGMSRPIISRGVAYVIAGPVTAYNATTGAVLWNTTLPGGSLAYAVAATIDEKLELLFVPTTTGLTALKVGDGSVKWTASIGGDGNGPPALVDGAVAIADNVGNLYVYDAATGAQLFPSVLPTPDGTGSASAPLGGCGTFVTISLGDVGTSSLAAFNAVTNASMWNTTLPGVAVTGSLLANCTVYVQDGQAFTAISVTNGTTLYQNYNAVGAPIGSTVVPLKNYQAAYVIGSTPAVLQIVDLPSGDLLYNATIPLTLATPNWLGVSPDMTTFYVTTGTSYYAVRVPKL
jgi:outer membrane protein assembly factor BamB